MTIHKIGKVRSAAQRARHPNPKFFMMFFKDFSNEILLFLLTVAHIHDNLAAPVICRLPLNSLHLFNGRMLIFTMQQFSRGTHTHTGFNYVCIMRIICVLSVLCVSCVFILCKICAVCVYYVYYVCIMYYVCLYVCIMCIMRVMCMMYDYLYTHMCIVVYPVTRDTTIQTFISSILN